MQRMLETEHPVDYVPGFENRYFTPSSLEAEILNGRVHGFVGVRGGRERANDKVSRLFSFVVQRAQVRKDEIGEVTKRQLRSEYGDRYEKMLNDYSKRYYTCAKRYADTESAGLLVMTTSYFRFLVQKRSFRGYEIVHFLRYNHRPYLSSYLLPMMLRRQKIQERIENGDHSLLLESSILKVLCNGFYGFNSIVRSKYKRTVVRSSSQLAAPGNKTLQRAKGVNVLGTKDAVHTKQRARAREKKLAANRKRQRTQRSKILRKARNSSSPEERAMLLASLDELPEPADDQGGDDSGTDEEDAVDGEVEKDLIFSVTLGNEKANDHNLIQISACILGHSKVIYLDRVYFLLDCLSSKENEFLYGDTDSAIVGSAHENLRDGVEKRKLKEWDDHVDEHLFTEGSTGASHGKLKYDWFGTKGLFHSGKTYFLEDGREGKDGGTHKRFKGCSRSVQQFLSPEYYDLDEATGLAKKSGFANRRKLGPTEGYEMVIRTESRRLSTPVCLKRKFDVRMQQHLIDIRLPRFPLSSWAISFTQTLSVLCRNSHTAPLSDTEQLKPVPREPWSTGLNLGPVVAAAAAMDPSVKQG